MVRVRGRTVGVESMQSITGALVYMDLLSLAGEW
jgi:hypothetical protein